MKSKVIKLAILVMIVSFVFLSQIHPVHAWGPISHIYMTEQAIEEVKTQSGITEFINIIEQNKEWFKCGLMFPDVAVIYYYTNWTSYQATHAWSRQSEMWREASLINSRQAMAFALGVGTHLIQDSIVHNYYIPGKIQGTLIQNNIIHPVIEAIIETKVVSFDPFVEDRTIDAFNSYNRPFTDVTWINPTTGVQYTPISWGNKIIGRDFSSEANLFNQILSGRGFSEGFKGYSFIQQAGPLWDLFHLVAGGMKYMLADEDPKVYLDRSKEKTAQWYTSGLGDSPSSVLGGEVEPTGNDALKAADSFVSNITIVILVVTVSIIVYYYYRKIRKSRKTQ